MKEIGGYIELGGLINKPYHNAKNFNSSRNALRYYIQEKNIKKIYLPYYLCQVVYDAINKENIDVEFYHIDENFEPLVQKIDINSYIYIVNYYGIISNDRLLEFKKKYINVIVDNTHAFFQESLYVCTIYNCRKYFGVPDGAYMYADVDSKRLNDYKVNENVNHLIGRLEDCASSYYDEFSKNDKKFDEAPICNMSKVSKILMGALDYNAIENQRKKNFKYLHNKLKKYQKLKIEKDLDFMYPLYVENGNSLRSKLISKKIYVPKLWPNIEKYDMLNDIEKKYIENIVPLPIDQRYTIEDMELIVKCIEEELCIN